MPTDTTVNPIVNSESAAPSAEQTEQFKLAYEKLADERAALAEDRIERINVDIPKAVNTVFGCLPQIQALSAEVKALPSFDASTFEKIEAYAQALSYSQMLYNAASKPIEYVPELAAELAKVRERLMSDASALATRGFLDASRLTELKGATGYKNIAYDVGTLVAMMRSAWAKVAGKTAVSEVELTSAQVQAEKLLRAVAAREQQEVDVSAAADQRQRAFTLLANAYDQARRAASFLRWDQNIEEIVPSFYNGRGASKKNKDEAPVPAPAPATPATSASGGSGISPAPGTSASGANGTSPAPGTGLPGTSPFATG